jgi:hypothetical protein
VVVHGARLPDSNPPFWMSSTGEPAALADPVTAAATATVRKTAARTASERKCLIRFMTLSPLELPQPPELATERYAATGAKDHAEKDESEGVTSAGRDSTHRS